MNKILKRGVCFQKRGVKNYCVNTWLVSLPPTLALSDNISGCPSLFEMLMDFLNVLLQNFRPSSSKVFSTAQTILFTFFMTLPFQAVCMAVYKHLCVKISDFFEMLKSKYCSISTQLLQLKANASNTISKCELQSKKQVPT